MPTGYTAKIEKGVTFKEFALDCARAFGACVTLRDEAGGGEVIPEKFLPSTYSLDKYHEAVVELDRLRNLSVFGLVEATDAYNKEKLEEYERLLREDRELKQKYQNMIAEVRRWTPPTEEHIRLKHFMLEQLESSMRFDCGEPEKPVELSTGEWLEKQIKDVEWQINYHKKEYAEEVERCKRRTAWVQQLRDSLK